MKKIKLILKGILFYLTLLSIITFFALLPTIDKIQFVILWGTMMMYIIMSIKYIKGKDLLKITFWDFFKKYLYEI